MLVEMKNETRFVEDSSLVLIIQSSEIPSRDFHLAVACMGLEFDRGLDCR